MGNYSVYVYKTISDYMKLYPKGQPDSTETHVEALLVGNLKFVIITDLKEKVAGYKADTTKTLVYFNHGMEKWEKTMAKYIDVQHVTDVKFTIKSKMVDFEGDGYGIRLPCAKYVGMLPEDGFFTHDVRVEGFILFDEVRNRLNLILEHQTSDDNS